MKLRKDECGRERERAGEKGKKQRHEIGSVCGERFEIIQSIEIAYDFLGAESCTMRPNGIESPHACVIHVINLVIYDIIWRASAHVKESER